MDGTQTPRHTPRHKYTHGCTYTHTERHKNEHTHAKWFDLPYFPTCATLNHRSGLAVPPLASCSAAQWQNAGACAVDGRMDGWMRYAHPHIKCTTHARHRSPFHPTITIGIRMPQPKAHARTHARHRSPFQPTHFTSRARTHARTHRLLVRAQRPLQIRGRVRLREEEGRVGVAQDVWAGWGGVGCDGMGWDVIGRRGFCAHPR